MEAGAAAESPATVEKVERYALPEGVYAVEDGQGRQWTDINGAARLVGKSRRTIHQWIAHKWVTVRRTPAGRAEILVATLWRDPVEADQPPAPVAEASNG